MIHQRLVYDQMSGGSWRVKAVVSDEVYTDNSICISSNEG